MYGPSRFCSLRLGQSGCINSAASGWNTSRINYSDRLGFIVDTVITMSGLGFKVDAVITMTGLRPVVYVANESFLASFCYAM